ncbi:MAG: putative membrane protein [Sulfitobacter sp.]
MKLEQETIKPPKRGIFAAFRGNFLTGLIVIAPIGLTIWFIWSIIGWVDGFVLPFLPDAYNPADFINRYLDIGIDIRGIGVIVFLFFTFAVGWLAKGLIGRWMLGVAERFVFSIPLVRSIYSGLKQITETVFAQGSANFEQACLVEYPRRGIWAIAFVSTTAKGEVASRASTPMISIFLPTTPNPTSGFLLFVPREDVIMLEMSVEDAAKLVISAGLVYPNGQDNDAPEAPPAIG